MELVLDIALRITAKLIKTALLELSPELSLLVCPKLVLKFMYELLHIDAYPIYRSET